MKALVLSVILITAFAPLMNMLSAANESSALDPSSKFYEDYIDKYISRCRTKAALFKNLKFKNIQKMVSLARQKAAFLSENKNRLINEMSAENIGRKHYKVKLYLNKRFNELTQGKNDVAVSQAAATLGN